MDTLWMIIYAGIRQLQAGLNEVFSLLHIFGPTVTIAVVAALTVALTKLLTKRFKTRRYRELERDFFYWYSIKQEVIQAKRDDPETAKQLGRNIDQGKLNKAYYDYFFEGLLNNLLTMYIPLLSMLAYVNYTYRPEALQHLFGQDHLFVLHWFGGQSYEIGAAFWFVCCVAATYLLWFLCRVTVQRFRRGGRNETQAEAVGVKRPLEATE